MSSDELVEYTCKNCDCKTAAQRDTTRFLERLCYRCWCTAKGLVLE